MSNTYSDIKLYNINPNLLSKAARKAIINLGWEIQRESESNIVATLPRIDGSQCAQITVHIMSSYVEVYYESDCELSFQQLIDSQNTVKQFFQAMDEQLESLSFDELKNHKEPSEHLPL